MSASSDSEEFFDAEDDTAQRAPRYIYTLFFPLSTYSVKFLENYWDCAYFFVFNQNLNYFTHYSGMCEKRFIYFKKVIETY